MSIKIVYKSNIDISLFFRFSLFSTSNWSNTGISLIFNLFFFRNVFVIESCLFECLFFRICSVYLIFFFFYTYFRILLLFVQRRFDDIDIWIDIVINCQLINFFIFLSLIYIYLLYIRNTLFTKSYLILTNILNYHLFVDFALFINDIVDLSFFNFFLCLCINTHFHFFEFKSNIT